MLSKEKYYEVGLKTDSMKLGKQIDLYLEYYLIKSIYNDDDNKNIKTFGIEVVKKELLENEIIDVEQKQVEHLSCDCSKVEQLLNTLFKNTVTPVSLIGILDGLLGVSY